MDEVCDADWGVKENVIGDRHYYEFIAYRRDTERFVSGFALALLGSSEPEAIRKLDPTGDNRGFHEAFRLDDPSNPELWLDFHYGGVLLKLPFPEHLDYDGLGYVGDVESYENHPLESGDPPTVSLRDQFQVRGEYVVYELFCQTNKRSVFMELAPSARAAIARLAFHMQPLCVLSRGDGHFRMEYPIYLMMDRSIRSRRGEMPMLGFQRLMSFIEPIIKSHYRPS